MPLSRTDITRAIAAFDAEIEAVGVPTQFVLRDGTTFTIKTLANNRPDENLTEGLVQQGFDIKFMAGRWDAATPTGRQPEKVDQLIRAGRRHAIEYVYKQTADNVDVGYICRVLG
jgi:hypothetical protein